jgi:hypothetical protein
VGLCRALVAVTAVFAVTGCTVVTGTAAAPTTGTTTTTTTPAPYETTTPTLELSDRTTKPGTTLKFGEQALVPYYGPNAKGLLGITVSVESRPATDADVDSLPLKAEDKAKMRGKTLFFVHQILVDVDGVNFTEMRMPALTTGTRGGGVPGIVLGASGIAGCQSVGRATTYFTTKGAKFEQCNWYFGEASDPIDSLKYTDQPYDGDEAKAVHWHA